jgi:preprotein translocase subunit SecG
LVSKAGIIAIVPDGAFLTVSMWVLTGYFALGIVLNAISRSKKERMLMTPVVILLTVIFFVVAAS